MRANPAPSHEWAARNRDDIRASARSESRKHCAQKAHADYGDGVARLDIAALENEHRRLIGAANRGYEQFRQVDSAFHSTIIRQLNNRFVNEVHEAVTFAFHFHRRRSDKDEFERSTRAIREHLKILDALLARDFIGAELDLTWHLATSRRTLLQSIDGNSHRNRRRPVLSAQPSLS